MGSHFNSRSTKKEEKLQKKKKFGYECKKEEEIFGWTIKIALLGKRKLGFVTDTCIKESFTAELNEQWETFNVIVLSWLMNTISTELLSGIAYASNAHFVREDLRERFDKMNRMRIFQLHRATANLSKGTDLVSSYFTKLKSL
ncbi:uncharacterized protein [Nicotiana sylvestris]|uniref:uncharacterized protein n=1 Tax=Nicotiana sylvestris TaxID=4096 RepID=UPI00388C913B